MILAQSVPLAQLLTKVERAVAVDPETDYEMLGVRSFGAGAFAANRLRGTDTKYPVLLEVRAGDFVYPKLMAWEGAFALTPSNLAHRFVSPEFCTFEIDQSRLVPSFLDYYFRRPSTWRRVVSLSTGTNVRRRRLHPDELLSFTLPLPPMTEQQRIVQLLDATLGRLGVIGELSRRTSEQGKAAWWSVLSERLRDLENKTATKALVEVVSINPESVNPAQLFADSRFRYVDIGSVENGSGTLHPKEISGLDAPSRARRRIRANDVLVSTVRPYLRGVALVPPELDGQVCSTGFAVLRAGHELLPRFLFAQATSNYLIDQLTRAMKGGHYPAVNDVVLRSVRLVVPGIARQEAECRRLDSLESRLRRVQELHEDRSRSSKQLGISLIEHTLSAAGL